MIAKILVVFMVLAACSPAEEKDEPPAHIVDEETMVKMLTDMHLIEGAKIGQKVMGDTLKVEMYYAKMYRKYGVSKEQFEENFAFYTRQPEVMNDLYQQVIEELNKIQQEPPRTPLVEKKAPAAVDSSRMVKRNIFNLKSRQDTAADSSKAK